MGAPTAEPQLERDRSKYDDHDLKQFNATYIALQLLTGELLENKDISLFDDYVDYLRTSGIKFTDNLEEYIRLLRAYFEDIIQGNFYEDSFYDIYDFNDSDETSFRESSKAFTNPQKDFLYPEG